MGVLDCNCWGRVKPIPCSFPGAKRALTAQFSDLCAVQVWGLLAAAAMIFLPAIESRAAFATTVNNIVHGRKTMVVEGEPDGPVPLEMDATKHGKDASSNGKEGKPVSESAEHARAAEV